MNRAAAINDRVAFLYAEAEGAANLGRVLALMAEPGGTWPLARVAWDNGEIGWSRHCDLVPLGTALRFWE